MNVREAFLHHPEEHTQNTEVQLQYQVNSKWSLSGVGNQNGSFGLDARYHKEFDPSCSLLFVSIERYRGGLIRSKVSVL